MDFFDFNNDNDKNYNKTDEREKDIDRAIKYQFFTAMLGGYCDDDED